MVRVIHEENFSGESTAKPSLRVHHIFNKTSANNVCTFNSPAVIYPIAAVNFQKGKNQCRNVSTPVPPAFSCSATVTNTQQEEVNLTARHNMISAIFFSIFILICEYMWGPSTEVEIKPNERQHFFHTERKKLRWKRNFLPRSENNEGIDGVVQRLPAAEMSLFPQSGTGDTRDTDRARSSAIQRLPHRLPSLPATTQNAYSMWKACVHCELK